MPSPRTISAQKSFTTQTGENIRAATRGALYDFQSQLNTRTQARGIKDRRPSGARSGDSTTRIANGSQIAIAVYAERNTFLEAVLPGDISNQLAYQEGNGVPTTTQFPNPGDNGEYFDTATSKLWIVRNRAGTLIYLNFVAISGSISAAQHGDLSAAGGTMHAFDQITGSITAAQHGNFTATAANDNLHALATSARPGFLSAAFFSRLNNATDAATGSTLVLRDASGNAAFTLAEAVTFDASSQYRVGGTKVVGARNTGWTAFTGTTDKATAYNTATVTLIQLAERVAAIQAALTGHGLTGA